MLLLLVFTLLFVSALKSNVAVKPYPAYEARDALLKDILNNYQPAVRPAHANETTMLHVNIEILHFDYRENSGAFHLVGVLHVKWHDPKLVWNPQSYGNMTQILINQRYIWVPDLEFYNNAPDKFFRMNHNGFVSVKSNGVVFWSDSIEVNIFCNADMKNWPHDKHECRMVLGSWMLHGLELDIIHLEPNSSMTFGSVDMKNMEYKITEFNASHVIKYYSCCLQPYITMDYDITFERYSSYAVIFRMPALTVMLFTLIAVKMEPSRSEKLWLNGFSFILTSWQLIYFAKNIGYFQGTPNIVVFFSTCIGMITVGQLLAIFSLFATHSKSKCSLPIFMETFSNCSFNRYLVPIEQKSNDRYESEGISDNFKLSDTTNLIERNFARSDWPRLAKIFNILAFLAFSFIFLIVTSVCLV